MFNIEMADMIAVFSEIKLIKKQESSAKGEQEKESQMSRNLCLGSQFRINSAMPCEAKIILVTDLSNHS